METVAWAGVVRTAIAIVGLGLTLAALSYASWRASLKGEGLRREFGRPAILVLASGGLLLITLSVMWGAGAPWERGLWAVLSLLLAWCTVAPLRRERTRG